MKQISKQEEYGNKIRETFPLDTGETDTVDAGFLFEADPLLQVYTSFQDSDIMKDNDKLISEIESLTKLTLLMMNIRNKLNQENYT